MSEQHLESWEARVQDMAKGLPYPPTPDIAGAVRRRLAAPPAPSSFLSRSPRWVAVAVLVLLILVGLLAVPQVRAAVVEWLQLGAVRIFLVEPTPTATATPTLPATEPALSVTEPAPSPTATPVPSPTPLSSLLDLGGETTLAEAQAQVDFSIRLPVEPPELGPPDAVFLQDLQGQAVILVWLNPDNPVEVELSLHLLGPGTLVEKGAPVILEETTVNGQEAFWVTGPHVLQNRRGDFDFRRLVTGNVLIWREGVITYRLETKLSLAEARRIAESLTP